MYQDMEMTNLNSVGTHLANKIASPGTLTRLLKLRCLFEQIKFEFEIQQPKVVTVFKLLLITLSPKQAKCNATTWLFTSDICERRT